MVRQEEEPGGQSDSFGLNEAEQRVLEGLMLNEVASGLSRTGLEVIRTTVSSPQDSLDAQERKVNAVLRQSLATNLRGSAGDHSESDEADWKRFDFLDYGETISEPVKGLTPSYTKPETSVPIFVDSPKQPSK